MTTQYHRPSNLDEATELATAPNTVILGGGTVVGATRLGTDMAIVDLQDAGLAGIEPAGDRLRIGAMTRLTEVSESSDVPEVLADLARRELPRSLRNSATVGGTVAAANADSQFLAGLLAFRAVVSFATVDGPDDLALRDLLASGMPDGAVITSVSVDGAGTAAADRTARTPGDVPIVSAVANKTPDGGLCLALTGVASTPITMDPTDLGSLEPKADFRGSAEYRIHLAKVLSRRVVDEVGGVA